MATELRESPRRFGSQSGEIPFTIFAVVAGMPRGGLIGSLWSRGDVWGPGWSGAEAREFVEEKWLGQYRERIERPALKQALSQELIVCVCSVFGSALLSMHACRRVD